MSFAELLTQEQVERIHEFSCILISQHYSIPALSGREPTFLLF